MTDIREEVKKYYSKITGEKDGVMETKIGSCALDDLPNYVSEARSLVSDEIVKHFYGCGSPIPPALEGMTVLDLGCGTGYDVYTIAKLVGENGRVIGVDMNEDQLDIAKKHQDEMAEKMGYKKSNVEFKKGYIEDLKSLGIENGSVDIVISNCVINLSPFKEEVFKEIWRVLKTGGELYFSDIFSDRRFGEDISTDLILRGECLGGAMYIEDFRRLLKKIGWEDFRYIKSNRSIIANDEIESMVGNVEFYSHTIKAVKLPALIEDICENYGQVAIYKGGIEGMENYFDLDDHHRFYKDLPLAVCGNTCAMIESTRLSKYFDIIGDRSKHFGAFLGCSTAPAKDTEKSDCCSGGGCC